MNKTLVILGVGIWGVMLILSFMFRGSLGGLGLTCDQVAANLLPLSAIEIIAFVIAIIGIIKRD